MRKKRTKNRRKGIHNTIHIGPSISASGGTFYPISEGDVQEIAKTALTIISEIGLSNCSKLVKDIIIEAGGTEVDGRLLFNNEMIKNTINGMIKTVTLFGQTEVHDLEVGGSNSYTGTGGAAPNILDFETKQYRHSTLIDLYNAARLCDSLNNIQFFSRSLVARDIDNPRMLDVNTAYAALSGTTKHVMLSASDESHVNQIAQMCYIIAGSEQKFRERPFASFNVNHVIPPLRFHKESTGVMAAAIKAGFPIHANVFGQLGASSPVTIAGSVAQTIAETLAGVTLAYAIDPTARIIAGPRPMITDLRTGGFSGGSGEQALATAICAQVLRSWDLPCSVIAGATDSKLPDAQAGYEKALNVSTAIQAGANLVTQACGMQAGLMGVSLEAYIIDNDMLGSILRSNVSPEVNQTTLAVEQIKNVVFGEGHFLGQAETYARMRSDFLYPQIANRQLIGEWQDSGGPELIEIAHTKVREILGSHYPKHIKQMLDQQIRENCNILLPKTVMEKDC